MRVCLLSIFWLLMVTSKAQLREDGLYRLYTGKSVYQHYNAMGEVQHSKVDSFYVYFRFDTDYGIVKFLNTRRWINENKLFYLLRFNNINLTDTLGPCLTAINTIISSYRVISDSIVIIKQYSSFFSIDGTNLYFEPANSMEKKYLEFIPYNFNIKERHGCNYPEGTIDFTPHP